MESSHRFFANKNCQYYPCHENIAELNCLFCFCPLYTRSQCPGNPTYIKNGGKTIKSCQNCTFPHQPENYERIIAYLSEK